MTHFEIREKFLNFFKSKGHIIEKSASLIPSNDSSLLFTSAGMVPFKDFFTGKIKTDQKRRTSIQKCVRTNDIENIGVTSRHLSFFEMLGNFSFGDYFKEEAISWAWEFLTEVLNLDKDKLYVTIYKDDEESFKIWEKIVDKNRITKLGEDSNFWSIGKIGPCGPCSEILYDKGEKFGCMKPTCAPGCDCDRYLEIWNLVFTQFERDINGNLLSLKQKNIDTGMGLERIASIMQNADTIFDTDLFQNIIKNVVNFSDINKTSIPNEKSKRIIADHIRSIVFLLADGAIPSNEGRGYVLRKLIRGAARNGNKFGLENFLGEIADPFISEMAKIDDYKYLLNEKNKILSYITEEEKKFLIAIKNAEKIFNETLLKYKEKNIKVFSGQDIFKLFDTFGMPIDIIEELAKENDLKLDIKEFDIEMQKQKERSKNSIEGWNKERNFINELNLNIFNEKQKFFGYEKLELETEILKIFKIENEKIILLKNNEYFDINSGEIGIILKETPFFTESGGQKSDIGIIEIFVNEEKTIFSVEKSKKYSLESKENHKNIWAIHFGKIIKGKISFKNENFLCIAKVNKKYRNSIKKNHTGVHLLQAVLRKFLGNNVSQKGSEVKENGFRFDFNSTEPISKDLLEKIEKEVNEIILYDYPVITKEMNIIEAKNTGALSFFDDKYGDIVRVVSIGDNISKEFCAGTHVKNTSEIGIFKILSESGISNGIRRIEGITGFFAYKNFFDITNKLKNIKTLLKNNNDNIVEQIENTLKQNKSYETDLYNLNCKILKYDLEKEISKIDDKNQFIFLIKKLEKIDTKIILNAVDNLKNKIDKKDFLFCFFIKNQEKLNFMILTNENFKQNKSFSAKDLLKKLNENFNFGFCGGGKEFLVQGNIKNYSNFNLDKFSNFIKKLL